jgi:hypothetical protein
MAVNIYKRGNSILEIDDSTQAEPYFLNFKDIVIRPVGDFMKVSQKNVILNGVNEITVDYNDVVNISATSGEELVELVSGLFTTSGGEVSIPNFEYVSTKSDLPSPVAGVITLDAEKTYYFTADVDLTGDRLVGSQDTVILGSSSENCSITSTGLTAGVALFTTEWTTPIRHITFRDVDTCLDINGVTNAPVALDWTGVNFLNIPNIGAISTCDNWIYSKGAFLNSKGFVFTGSVGTIGIDNSIFVGPGSAGSIISLDAGLTVTRRFRVIYSSIVAFGATIGIDASTSATIPTEGYIFDTVNFSGGSTYLSGITETDNRTRIDNSRGVKNTAEIGNYYMLNNATVTTITSAGVPVKIEGTSTANAINQKFSHSDNRLTYTGGLTRNFQVSATASFTSGNNRLIGLYVAKNGVVIADSEMYATTSGSGRAEAIHVQTIFEMDENDYVELWIENDSNTDNITVEFLNFICKSLD